MNYELSGECIGIELTTTLDYLRVRVRWKDECLPWDIAGRFADALKQADRYNRHGDLFQYKRLPIRRYWNKTVIQIGTAPLSISPHMAQSIADRVKRFYGSYLRYRTRINLPIRVRDMEVIAPFTLDYYITQKKDRN